MDSWKVVQNASDGDVHCYTDEATIEAYLKHVGDWGYFMMGRRAMEGLKHFDADGGVSWMMFRVDRHRPAVEAVVGGAGHARAGDNGLMLLRLVDPTPATLGQFVTTVRAHVVLDEMQALSYLSQQLGHPDGSAPWR